MQNAEENRRGHEQPISSKSEDKPKHFFLLYLPRANELDGSVEEALEVGGGGKVALEVAHVDDHAQLVLLEHLAHLRLVLVILHKKGDRRQAGGGGSRKSPKNTEDDVTAHKMKTTHAGA